MHFTHFLNLIIQLLSMSENLSGHQNKFSLSSNIFSLRRGGRGNKLLGIGPISTLQASSLIGVTQEQRACSQATFGDN